MPKRRELRKIQTTLRLPGTLYAKVKSLIEQGATNSRNFNEFVVEALRAYVRLAMRRRIDQAFAAMAEDTDYQKEAESIAEQFAESDWEALEAARESGAEH